ncbi:MAG: hypothetical protein WA940_06110 [Sphingopyxis sp.]
MPASAATSAKMGAAAGLPRPPPASIPATAPQERRIATDGRPTTGMSYGFEGPTPARFDRDEDWSRPFVDFRKTGAGEGIRTLDPNLGKVAFSRFWLFSVDCR